MRQNARTIYSATHIHSNHTHIHSNHTLHPFKPHFTSIQTTLYFHSKKKEQISGVKLPGPGKFLFWRVGVTYILSHATTHLHSKHTLHPFKPHSISIQTTLYVHSKNTSRYQVQNWLDLENVLFWRVGVTYILSHATTHCCK
jgi:hypothetical protein